MTHAQFQRYKTIEDIKSKITRAHYDIGIVMYQAGGDFAVALKPTYDVLEAELKRLSQYQQESL